MVGLRRRGGVGHPRKRGAPMRRRQWITTAVAVAAGAALTLPMVPPRTRVASLPSRRSRHDHHVGQLRQSGFGPWAPAPRTGASVKVRIKGSARPGVRTVLTHNGGSSRRAPDAWDPPRGIHQGAHRQPARRRHYSFAARNPTTGGRARAVWRTERSGSGGPAHRTPCAPSCAARCSDSLSCGQRNRRAGAAQPRRGSGGRARQSLRDATLTHSSWPGPS
jgi:hypothetical protein